MLRGDREVTHPGVFREFYPAGGIEVLRIKFRREFFVGRDGNLFAKHQPLADVGHAFPFPDTGGNRIEPPVDKHAEAGIAPPFERVYFGGRLA